MLDEPMNAGLDTRVRGLERANRRLTLGLLVMGALLAIAATRPPGDSETVRTRTLEVVDAGGRVHARFAATEAGPELILYDDRGSKRASLEHRAHGTGLYLLDSTATVRVGTAQFAHGGGGFALHGEESKGGAFLYLKAGKGSLTFMRPDGSIQSRLPETP